MNKKHRYYVAGARYTPENEPSIDMREEFFTKGIWTMGWEKGQEYYDVYMATIKDIKPGDRIAIKKNCNDNLILIEALGIVKGRTEKMVHVEWVATDLEYEKGKRRKVDSNGCRYDTICNVTEKDEAWLNQAFRL